MVRACVRVSCTVSVLLMLTGGCVETGTVGSTGGEQRKPSTEGNIGYEWGTDCNPEVHPDPVPCGPSDGCGEQNCVPLIVIDGAEMGQAGSVWSGCFGNDALCGSGTCNADLMCEGGAEAEQQEEPQQQEPQQEEPQQEEPQEQEEPQQEPQQTDCPTGSGPCTIGEPARIKPGTDCGLQWCTTGCWPLGITPADAECNDVTKYYCDSEGMCQDKAPSCVPNCPADNSRCGKSDECGGTCPACPQPSCAAQCGADCCEDLTCGAVAYWQGYGDDALCQQSSTGSVCDGKPGVKSSDCQVCCDGEPN